MSNLLRQGAESFGLNLTDQQITALNIYKKMLIEWNEKINLTAICEDEEIVLKHFVDSFSLAPYISDGASLVDVGTGAGFPGLALKIARPDLKVTLMDAVNKKVNFLNAVINELKLTGVKCIHTRAEDAGTKQFREVFDYATARAVANLSVLAEYCLPMVKLGGIFLAMKGSEVDQEVQGATKAVRVLGGEIEGIKQINISNNINHSIILIKKVDKTPLKYPRKAGKATKEPII